MLQVLEIALVLQTLFVLQAKIQSLGNDHTLSPYCKTIFLPPQRCSKDRTQTQYSGTSLIRTSLNRNLANPNGKALVNFFFFWFAILTYFFLYSDGACPSSTPSLAADSTFLTCMNKDVSIHAKLLTSFTHHLASNTWPNLKFGSGTMKCNCPMKLND